MYSTKQISFAAKCREAQRNLARQIMNELYRIIPAPRYTSLLLFLASNYPEHNNEADASFIWDCCFYTDEYLLSLLN